MDFRLSNDTKALVAQNSAKLSNKVQKSRQKSQMYYHTYPNLIPNNVYLRSGRVVDMKQVDEILRNFVKRPFWQDVQDFVTGLLGSIAKKIR